MSKSEVHLECIAEVVTSCFLSLIENFDCLLSIVNLLQSVESSQVEGQLIERDVLSLTSMFEALLQLKFGTIYSSKISFICLSQLLSNIHGCKFGIIDFHSFTILDRSQNLMFGR